MKELLKGKTAIVTGANRGIGEAIVKKFTEQGCNVIACARKKNEEFENKCAVLEQLYHVRVIPIYFDLENKEEMELAVKTIRNEKQQIDILVNNAGILSEYINFSMMPIEKVRETFNIDYFSQMLFTQYIVRLMMRAKGDRSIIFISSIASLDGFFSSYDYCACKAAINTSVIQLARELGTSSIRVNAVAPGLVMTDMIKENDSSALEAIIPAIMLRRFGEKEEIAAVVAFLASEEAKYITGQIVRVDGGTNPPKSNW